MRIRVVDNDVRLQCSLGRFLRRHGHTVDVAGSVKDALSKVSGEPPPPYEALVLDHNLADGTGIDLHRRLREMGVSAPSLLFTGCLDVRTECAALDAGMADVVHKGRSLDVLHARLKARTKTGAG